MIIVATARAREYNSCPSLFPSTSKTPIFYIEVSAVVYLQIFFNFNDSLKLFSNYGSLSVLDFRTPFTPHLLLYTAFVSISPLNKKQIRMTH